MLVLVRVFEPVDRLSTEDEILFLVTTSINFQISDSAAFRRSPNTLVSCQKHE